MSLGALLSASPSCPLPPGQDGSAPREVQRWDSLRDGKVVLGQEEKRNQLGMRHGTHRRRHLPPLKQQHYWTGSANRKVKECAELPGNPPGPASFSCHLRKGQVLCLSSLSLAPSSWPVSVDFRNDIPDHQEELVKAVVHRVRASF